MRRKDKHFLQITHLKSVALRQYHVYIYIFPTRKNANTSISSTYKLPCDSNFIIIYTAYREIFACFLFSPKLSVSRFKTGQIPLSQIISH